MKYYNSTPRLTNTRNEVKRFLQVKYKVVAILFRKTLVELNCRLRSHFFNVVHEGEMGGRGKRGYLC